MKVYRILRTAAQTKVITSSEFVAMRLESSGWHCVGTGSAIECEAMIERSAEGRSVRWNDVPCGAQAVIK